MNASDWQAIRLSLLVAIGAVLWIAIPGIAVGWMLGRSKLRARPLWETLVALPLVLPPVVSGLIVLVLASPRGPLGWLWTDVIGGSPAFTPYGAIIASGIVAFPLLARTAATGFAALDRRLLEVAAGFGAGRLMMAREVIWPQARGAILSGLILAFGRALGEFGATVIVAGNIPGLTQTIPLAIYQKVQIGDDAAALRLTLIAIMLALVTVGWATALLNCRRPSPIQPN
ncbi:MAG: molybdate ABC transporter permease subunit [Candidatus Zixiibacteriota bacterium]